MNKLPNYLYVVGITLTAGGTLRLIDCFDPPTPMPWPMYLFSILIGIACLFPACAKGINQ